MYTDRFLKQEKKKKSNFQQYSVSNDNKSIKPNFTKVSQPSQNRNLVWRYKNQVLSNSKIFMTRYCFTDPIEMATRTSLTHRNQVQTAIMNFLKII